MLSLLNDRLRSYHSLSFLASFKNLLKGMFEVLLIHKVDLIFACLSRSLIFLMMLLTWSEKILTCLETGANLAFTPMCWCNLNFEGETTKTTSGCWNVCRGGLSEYIAAIGVYFLAVFKHVRPWHVTLERLFLLFILRRRLHDYFLLTNFASVRLPLWHYCTPESPVYLCISFPLISYYACEG